MKELPVANSEHAFFVESSWLKVGFNLLKTNANYNRDYLMPRLVADGCLQAKVANYDDIMGPGILDRAQ